MAGADFREPTAEGGEVVALEGHRGDRVAGVGVEAGGDENEIGLPGDHGVEGGAERGQMLGAGGVGGDGPVAEARAEVVRAGAGVAGVLVDGGEEKVGSGWVCVKDGFGAVAVMGIEIPDGDAADGGGNGRAGGGKIVRGVERGEGDLVEVAEAHGLAGGGVVAGRAQQREDGRAVREGVARGGEGAGDGAAGVVADAGEKRRVGVEVAGLREAFEVCGGVGEEERRVGDGGGGRRDGEGPRGARGAEVGGGAEDARGLLGAHGGAVVGTLRIVEKEHGRSERESEREREAGRAVTCVHWHFPLTFTFMNVVVLCSGGMDSVAALHWARREHAVAAVMSFDYGAKHNHREIPFAAEHAALVGARHEIVRLDFVDRLFASDLLQSGGEIPEGHYEAENMKQTVVPFRNAIMLSIACGFAESVGAEGLVIAAHGGDHAIYPDCREDFMRAMGDAMRLGTYAGVKLLRPFIALTKGEIAAAGVKLGVDFARTWSCYKGGAVHCGRCGTCVERREAFLLAGMKDPTVYASNEALPTKPTC